MNNATTYSKALPSRHSPGSGPGRRPLDPMVPRELRDAFSAFATGVTVVTCRNLDGTPHGATVNAFTAVSLAPALAQVTLTRTSRAGQLLAGRPFAINILAADQEAVASHFAGRPAAQPPRWVDDAPTPFLEGAAATISCHPWRTYDGGDHLIVIGQVVRAEISGAEPLLFHGGAFRTLRPLATADTTPDDTADQAQRRRPDVSAAPTPRPSRPARHLSSVGV